MRMRWCLGAAAFVVGASGCGGDTASTDSTPATTIAPVTTVVVSTTSGPATTAGPPATATAVSTTSSLPSSTVASTTTSAAEAPGAAEVALAPFLEAFEQAGTQIVAVTERIDTEIADTGEVSGVLYDEADAAGGSAYLLTRLVPAGLDPDVYREVHAAVFAMGQAAGAFLFAPGWTVEEWPDWSVGMAAAQAQLDTIVERVQDAAADAPDLATVVPGSREDAAHSVLELELIRTFGHGGPGLEVDAVPAAVRWIGALPEGALSGTDCFMDTDTGASYVPSGDFVDGMGGCALVFYDGELDSHEAEIAAWQADPSQPPSGEFVAFFSREGRFTPVGSAE